MIFDYSKLKGKIAEVYGTRKAFAEAIGKNPAYISRVLSGKSYLDQRDIIQWSDALDIGAMQVGEYFFAF